jgi:Barstar (barnase inhibitor)
VSVRLSAIISGTISPGIYRWQSRRNPDSLLAELAEAGWHGAVLDGRQICDKETFLAACGKAMQFPAYARPNWDSFEECMTDLNWIPAKRFVLIYDDPDPFSQAQPAEWQTAIAILQTAVANWQQQQTPFFVLLRSAGSAHNTIPVL